MSWKIENSIEIFLLSIFSCTTIISPVLIQSFDTDFHWKIKIKENNLIFWCHYINIALHIIRIQDLHHVTRKLNFLIVKNDQNNWAECLQVTAPLITLYLEFLINYILRHEEASPHMRWALWSLFLCWINDLFSRPFRVVPFGHFNLIPLKSISYHLEQARDR